MLNASAFGVYVHIPYCIQRCLYCDFATYEQSQILPPQEYIDLLVEEMRQKSKYFKPQTLKTIYFGGGTPSLVDPALLARVINQLSVLGFVNNHETEITIEINPATISPEKMAKYKDIGINRYSVGAQTFKDSLLKKIGREHNSTQTLETLSLLRSHTENFNFDILFALPNQSLGDLQEDLSVTLRQGANHISPYCLTIPKGHILSPGRAPDETQVEMFALIRSELFKAGFKQYEISNFSKPGYESKHNLLYWTDQEYWGLGLSAHSYSKGSEWGTRFWNRNSIGDYRKDVLANTGKIFKQPAEHLLTEQYEVLAKNQSLTDFCHTALRLNSGLSLESVGNKFSKSVISLVESRLKDLEIRGLTQEKSASWQLTEKGILLSNLAFEKMTFLADDLARLH